MRNMLFIIVVTYLTVSFKSIEKQSSDNNLEDFTNVGLDKIEYDSAKKFIDNFNNNSPFPNQINGFCIPKSFFKDIPNKNDNEGVEFIFGTTKNGITLIMKPARFNYDSTKFDNTNVWSSSIKESKNIEELSNNVSFIKKKDNYILLENAKKNYEMIYCSQTTQMRSFFVGKNLLYKIVYPDNKLPRTGIKIFLAKLDASSNNIDAIFQADNGERPPYVLKKSDDFQVFSCIYEHFGIRNFNGDEFCTIKPCPKYCGN